MTPVGPPARWHGTASTSCSSPAATAPPATSSTPKETRQPSLGIPAGVKVHSAVFGATPREAGRAALAFLRDGIGATRMAEVMDIDEDAARQGVAAARLYGYLRVPDDTARLQAAKDGGVESGDRAVKALAAAVAAKMEPGVTYVMGPGSTIAAVMDELGLDGTLLGVDVVRDGQVVASDAGERQVLDLIQGRDARIVVTVIGGQGHILGRGNQQISPQVVRAVGPANIIVAATTDKLASIQGRPPRRPNPRLHPRRLHQGHHRPRPVRHAPNRRLAARSSSTRRSDRRPGALSPTKERQPPRHSGPRAGVPQPDEGATATRLRPSPATPGSSPAPGLPRTPCSSPSSRYHTRVCTP